MKQQQDIIAAALKRAFAFTLKDFSRMALAGVHLERKTDGWVLTGCNGHRLVQVILPPDAIDAPEVFISATLHPLTMLALQAGRAFTIDTDAAGRWTVAGIETIREMFPNTARVIPADPPHSVEVDGAQIRATLTEIAPRWSAEQRLEYATRRGGAENLYLGGNPPTIGLMNRRKNCAMLVVDDAGWFIKSPATAHAPTDNDPWNTATTDVQSRSASLQCHVAFGPYYIMDAIGKRAATIRYTDDASPATIRIDCGRWVELHTIMAMWRDWK